MNKSPGHEQWPNHKVEEERLDHAMTVELGGETIARSNSVIRVKEDGHPDRYYFPRTDVKMTQLQRSPTVTTCPFKGQAHYFNVQAGGKIYKDAVWTYEDPYDEHRDLQDRVAFYDDKIPEILVRTA